MYKNEISRTSQLIKLYDLFVPLFSSHMLERGTSECHFQSVHSKHNFRKFFSESQKKQAARTWVSGKFIEHVEEVARIHFNKEGYTQGPPCDSMRSRWLIKEDQLCDLWHML